MLAVATLFTGCKESAGVETVVPTVSITADANFASDNTANLTLTLSEATTEEVTVTLGDAEVQSGKTKVTAIYSKTVTIKAGETSAKVTVQAETLGLESGEYQAAIQIVSAEGAEVAETPVVYIGFDYVEALAKTFYGIPQVLCFQAENLDIWGADVPGILENATKEIQNSAL